MLGATTNPTQPTTTMHKNTAESIATATVGIVAATTFILGTIKIIAAVAAVLLAVSSSANAASEHWPSFEAAMTPKEYHVMQAKRMAIAQRYYPAPKYTAEWTTTKIVNHGTYQSIRIFDRRRRRISTLIFFPYQLNHLHAR